MSTGSTGSILNNKWQLALLIGTPVAFGVGYYIYRKTATADVDDRKSKKKLLEDLKNKSISLDGTESDKDIENKKKKAELEGEKLSPLRQAQLYKDEGNVCYRKGKYDEAIQFYDKAIDKCPIDKKVDLSIFYQNRAAAYEMLKKWTQVKADCTKSLEYNPKYTKAFYRRAKAHEATKDLLDCLDDITATCILEVFQNHNSIMFADRVLKQTGNDDAIKEMLSRVTVLPSNSFIKTYFKSFVMDPLKLDERVKSEDNLRGYLKAKLAWAEENYGIIVPACTDEIESSESESEYKSEALLLRGTFHLLSGCFVDALQDLEAIINNPEANVNLRVNALIKRASLNVQIDKKDLGMSDFVEAEKLDPKNADIYHQRAQIYILVDKLEDSLIEFEKAIKIAPNHAMAYIQKCYAEYRLSFMSQDQMRLFGVMKEFKNALDKFPDFVDCYSLMAQVLSEQGQFDQADSFFEKALKMSPENATLYVHRGIMQLQWTGDVEKAIGYMNKSIEIDEKCELAYETLGTIEVQRANLDRAIELFECALRYAKSQSEMSHICALRNAARAQINVTRNLGIDMSTISALAAAGIAPN